MTHHVGSGPEQRPHRGARSGDAGSPRRRRAARPLTGLATIAAIAFMFFVATGFFRGDFTEAAAVTVISDRAGLVMNPDAKVKIHGVQVGKVASIETRPSGAVIHLAMDPGQLHLIPANVDVDVASTTVFGAKSVNLIAPPEPSPQTMQRGQVIEGKHVTVEINTVFEQLSAVLSSIQPEKLNQTLTAIASGLSGRGGEIGEMISDLDATLAVLDPGLGDLSRDIADGPPVLGAYADAAPDLLATVRNASSLSGTIVQQRRNLDALLISVIGFGDIGEDVVGANRRPLSDALRLLRPITGLTDRYSQALYCTMAGLLPLAKLPPSRVPGGEVNASFQWGADPYRYPSDLPKVAAKGGPQCVGLPNIPYETRPPFVVADVGTNPWKYGNQGFRLNTALLKDLLFGHQIDGPPRNSTQIGMPG